ncbi:MAG: lysylphosphatidylglycerol synthase domain-containing protein [Gammaproteobacteria bacterium]
MRNLDRKRIKRTAGQLLPVLVFCLAAGAVYQVLGDINPRQLWCELEKLSGSRLLLAALCALCSYLVLSGYDWSALRYLKRRVPFKTIALATFCGCAVANSLGLNIISGGSVRYRIYASAGLGIFDVARITVFGMVAFGLCIAVIAGAALAVYPDVFSGFFRISPSGLRAIGLSALGLFSVLAILAFAQRDAIRVGPWSFKLPSGQIALAQLAISVTDILAAGGCLYILLPEADIPFLGFLVVYAVGIVVGMASHVPGGLGVFDGIILLTFRSTVSPESLAAGLLVYRAVYNLVPLLIAIGMLTVREFAERGAMEGAE